MTDKGRNLSILVYLFEINVNLAYLLYIFSCYNAFDEVLD